MNEQWTANDDRLFEASNGTMEAACTRLGFAAGELNRTLRQEISRSSRWKWWIACAALWFSARYYRFKAKS